MENQQSMQEQYLAVIKQIIEDNIDNESFSVADLAREVGLSRSMLHRKLIRLTGKSATDLITEIRLTKAYELLENNAGTVSEIAYQVGYSSPSYFNKVFKKTYKVSAGDVRRKGLGKISHLRVIKEPGVPGSARSRRSRSRIIAGANILMIIIVTVGVVALILGLMDNVSPFSRFPEWTMNLILVILIVGIIMAIILYWVYNIHPEGKIVKTGNTDKVKQEDLPRSSKSWKITSYVSFVVIVGLILIVGILDYPKIFRSENLNSMTFPVRVDNEFGERETRLVFKEDYLTRLALFPFENETTDSSLNWLGWGIMDAVCEDQHQFSNMLVSLNGISLLLNQQITLARDGKYPHFLTGTYRVYGSIYEITTRLYQTSNGSIKAERDYRGADFFSLVDSISSQVRRDLNISEIILDATPDLPISAMMTNHLGAYKHYILGQYWLQLVEDPYSNLNKAIKLDSTFAKASLVFANYCFRFQASHKSAVKSINQTIRYRHRLSELSDIDTRLLHHMIKGDRESMIRLSEYLVELRPWDLYLLYNLHNNCLILGLKDRAVEVGVKLNAMVPNHPPLQLILANTYLISGKPDKAQEVLNELLAENPGNVEAMLLLGQAFLHENNLEAAEEIFKKAILLMPENEKYWSYFLTHISFIRDTENMEEVLKLFINTKKVESFDWTQQAFRIQNQLFLRSKNQRGLFFYPISDSVAFTAFENDFIKLSLIFSKQGKPVRATSRQLSISDFDALRVRHYWIEDSLILRAKDLLAEGLPEDALTAFTKAYKENPEHYYLANFIQHLQLFTSPEYETLKSVFKAYAGSYEDLEFEIQQDHFYYEEPRGLIFDLLPLSEDTFMVPGIYVLTVHVVKENGIVSGLKFLYRDGREEFYPRTNKAPLTQLVN